MKFAFRAFIFGTVLAFHIANTYAQDSRIKSSGDWVWIAGDTSGSAITGSTKFGNDLTLWVIFDARQNCNPTIVYSQTELTSSPKKAVGRFQGAFQIRIDTRSPWNVKPGAGTAFYSSPKNGKVDFNIGLDAPVKFIQELAFGQTLRLFRVDTGVTDRFSLTGSAVAIGSAFRVCEMLIGGTKDPDLQYFNQDAYRQQQPNNRTQDPDRQYFR